MNPSERMNLFERLRFMQRVWRYRRRSEAHQIRYLMSCDLSGKTLVDIGANRGIYSYLMHQKAGPLGRVVAVEPQPELSEDLERLKHSFRLTQLEIVEKAFSSTEGVMKLNRPRKHWGGATLENFTRADSEVMDVEVTTVDRFFANHPARPISFIKCDVEYHEYQVFLGAQRILSEDRPIVMFENADTLLNQECKVFHLLQELGYEGFYFAQNGLAPIAGFKDVYRTLSKHCQSDFVFRPMEEVARPPHLNRQRQFAAAYG